MYRVVLKTAITEALRGEFVNAINLDFRPPNAPFVSIEYPIEEAHYPGIWVQYADNAELSVAGIGHIEQSVDEVNKEVVSVTRWRFSGAVTLTCSALTSLERDRLYDEVVATWASSQLDHAYPFRAAIETNDLVAVNPNFDDLQPFGDQAALGTPWGTNEAIYETSLSFDLIGEYVSRPETKELVPLSTVVFTKYVEGSTLGPDPITPGGWDYTQWT